MQPDLRAVNKIVLNAGKIGWRQKVDVASLDASLLNSARTLLAQLRSGASEMPLEVSGRHVLTVALGIAISEETQRRLREHWIEMNPRLDLSEYDRIISEVAVTLRASGFYLTYGGIRASYALIPSDCEEHKPGLYGAICGSWLNAQHSLPENMRSRQSVAEQQPEHEAVLAEIVGLRPAYLAPTSIIDERTEFGDCLAVAMLRGE